MKALLQEAKKIISSINYINIASVTPGGQPWNTPVYFAHDKDLNFYWLSWKKNVHSQNIRNNSNVFVTIYDSKVPGGTGFGVYFQGKAYEINNPRKMITGLKTMYGKQNKKVKSAIMFLKNMPRRLYMFVPDKVWVNGDGDIDGEFIDVRTELDLTTLKGLFN